LPPRDYRLAGAGAEGDAQKGFPGDPCHVPCTYVERHVGWFGYDATLSGDDDVVVYVEEVSDLYRSLDPDESVPSPPMPVADDTCEYLPPPNPLYLGTLMLLRLD
jgi:hypothetical protein